MLAESPQDAFILFAIAKEYEGMGDDVAAMEHFQKLKEHEPGYVGLYYHLGKLRERMGDVAGAFHIYKEGMRIARNAGDQHSLNELAAAKLNLGDDEDFE